MFHQDTENANFNLNPDCRPLVVARKLGAVVLHQKIFGIQVVPHVKLVLTLEFLFLFQTILENSFGIFCPTNISVETPVSFNAEIYL